MSKCINCKHLGEDKKCFQTGEIETTNIEYDEHCNYFEPANKVCEWEKVDSHSHNNMFGCGNSYLTPENVLKRYKYCPYCGKTISIRG